MPLINKTNSDRLSQLCEQVERLSINQSNLKATITWTIPANDENNTFVGTRIVRKIGSCPNNPYDGVVIYEGTNLSYIDSPLIEGTTYFYRAFAYNAKKKYQTSMRYVSITAVNGISLASIPEGALLTINEGGTLVPFYVAKHNYENGLNGTGRTLVVRKDCYDSRPFDVNTDSDMDGYALSDIDIWLNGNYKSLFDNDLQNVMGSTSFYYTIHSNNPTLTTLSRSIFLLSTAELGFTGTTYNVEGTTLPISNVLKIAYNNGTAVSWWTRTPIINQTSDTVNAIRDTGSVRVGYQYDEYWTRPVFTIPNTVVITPEPNTNGFYELLSLN